MAADRVIRWTTAGAVAGVAARASYEHAHALARAHGEAGRTGRPDPLTMDGLIYVTSIVMLNSARRKVPVRALAGWLLGLGIAGRTGRYRDHGERKVLLNPGRFRDARSSGPPVSRQSLRASVWSPSPRASSLADCLAVACQAQATARPLCIPGYGRAGPIGGTRETNKQSGTDAGGHGEHDGRGVGGGEPGVGDVSPAAEHSPGMHRSAHQRQAGGQRMRAAFRSHRRAQQLSETITATRRGAAGPTVTFALTAGSLPPGLAMSTQSPTAAAITGNPPRPGRSTSLSRRPTQT